MSNFGTALTVPDAFFLQFQGPELEHFLRQIALQAQVLHVQLHLLAAVLKQHHHPATVCDGTCFKETIKQQKIINSRYFYSSHRRKRREFSEGGSDCNDSILKRGTTREELLFVCPGSKS